MTAIDDASIAEQSLLRLIFETTPAAIVVTNFRGRVIKSNPALREMLGYSAEDLHGMHWKRFTHPDDVPLLASSWEEMVDGRQRFIQCKVRYRRRNGEFIWVEFAGSLIQGTGSEEKLFIGLALDITRQQYEESRFRSIFEVSSVGMVLLDLSDRKVVEANNSLLKMFGYSFEELQRMTSFDITHPDDVAWEKETINRFIEGKAERAHTEKRYIHKDGRTIWGNVTGAVLKDPGGVPRFVISMVEDITQRKNAEKELLTYQEQVRSLASELSLAEEQDRRHIALYLHDRVAQNLSLSRMRLETLREQTSSPVFLEPLSQISMLVEEAVNDIRSAVMELSPPVLYELGLEAALEWLSDQMHERYGLAVELVDDGLPKPLHDDLRGVLFRSVRELLINVAKHADTASAKVSVRKRKNTICIKVRDNGTGFNVSQVRNKKYRANRFGLFNVKERMNYLGGRCDIESEPGSGTRVTLTGQLKSLKESQDNAQRR